MSDTSNSDTLRRPFPPTPNYNKSLLSRLVFASCRRALSRLERGSVALELPGGERAVFGKQGSGPHAELYLNNNQILWQSLRRGALGFADSYLDGHWDTPDLAAIFHLFLQNRPALRRSGNRWFRNGSGDKRYHLSRRNSRTGSRKNIEEHYDLGNAFYKLWLDPTMTYSSALFESADQSIEDAQANKYRRILELSGCTPGDDVLEIGCGWGGFAELAARNGAHVTGLTLSQEQLAFATHRLAAAGLSRNSTIYDQDYRDVDGTYDRIVSIEMIEAVGREHWGDYFRKISSCLKSDGVCVIQGITIGEENFPAYASRPDFIQRYIFPGGMLPTKTIMHEQAAKAGLEIFHEECFASSYVRTLNTWRDAFNDNWPAIRALGFDDRFKRLWNYYLEYCAVGFDVGTVDVGLYGLRHKS